MRVGSLLCPGALLQADETERQRERKSIVCQKREAQLENAIPFLGMYHTLHGILQARIPEWVAIPFSRGIFLTQGWNPCLPHCRRILCQLSHQGSPSQW